MTREPAMDIVLSKTDFRENILLNLEPRDILVNAQRINKAWYATIKNSPLLQQALFFQPVPSHPIKVWRVLERRNRACKLLKSNPGEMKQFMAMELRLNKVRIVQNPISTALNLLNSTYRDPKAIINANRSYRSLQRPEASWRRMLFSQPPVQFFRGQERRPAMKLGDFGGVGLAARWVAWLEQRRRSMRKIQYAGDLREYVGVAVRIPSRTESHPPTVLKCNGPAPAPSNGGGLDSPALGWRQMYLRRSRVLACSKLRT